MNSFERISWIYFDLRHTENGAMSAYLSMGSVSFFGKTVQGSAKAIHPLTIQHDVMMEPFSPESQRHRCESSYQRELKIA